MNIRICIFLAFSTINLQVAENNKKRKKRDHAKKTCAVVIGGRDDGGDGGEGVLGDFVFSFLHFLFLLPSSYLLA